MRASGIRRPGARIRTPIPSSSVSSPSASRSSSSPSGSSSSVVWRDALHKTSVGAGEHVRVVVEDVRKTFKFRHTHSLKETFIAATRRRELSSTFNALNDVNITISEGESVALLGYNG